MWSFCFPSLTAGQSSIWVSLYSSGYFEMSRDTRRANWKLLTESLFFGSFFCLNGLNRHGEPAFLQRSHVGASGGFGQRSFWEWQRSQAARSRTGSSAIVAMEQVNGKIDFGNFHTEIVIDQSISCWVSHYPMERGREDLSKLSPWVLAQALSNQGTDLSPRRNGENREMKQFTAQIPKSLHRPRDFQVDALKWGSAFISSWGWSPFINFTAIRPSLNVWFYWNYHHTAQDTPRIPDNRHSRFP